MTSGYAYTEILGGGGGGGEFSPPPPPHPHPLAQSTSKTPGPDRVKECIDHVSGFFTVPGFNRSEIEEIRDYICIR